MQKKHREPKQTDFKSQKMDANRHQHISTNQDRCRAATLLETTMTALSYAVYRSTMKLHEHKPITMRSSNAKKCSDLALWPLAAVCQAEPFYHSCRPDVGQLCTADLRRDNISLPIITDLSQSINRSTHQSIHLFLATSPVQMIRQ